MKKKKKTEKAYYIDSLTVNDKNPDKNTETVAN